MGRSIQARAAAALFLAAAAAHAPTAEARFVFQQNHPDLAWYTIETEHFSVHYPKSRVEDGNEHYLTTEVSARAIARVAEEMWHPICEHYDYFLKERVHITVLNQSDDLEGFTVPPWDWIEISTNPGSYFYRQRGRMEWFSDVLFHEFAHIVSLKQSAHMAEGTQGVLLGGLYQDGLNDMDTGVEVFLMDNDPFFWSEGSAEGSSEMALGNWWTSARDQTLRTTILEDDALRLLSYDEWQARGWWGWNDGERNYQQGYAFNVYLRQRFGEDVFMRFAQEGGKRWRPNWMSVIEEVLGIDGRTLYDDWVEYQKERYNAQADAIRDRGEVVGRELLTEKPEWDYAKPSQREEWAAQDKVDILDKKHKTGTWQVYARQDPATGTYGWSNMGRVTLMKTPIDRHEAFTGIYPRNSDMMDEAGRYMTALPARFMYGWDFVPGQGKVVVSGNERLLESPFTAVTGARWELKGYDWNQLWVFDIAEREEESQGVAFKTWRPETMFNGKPKLGEVARPIPNTLRGADPTVSPDGAKVAYLQYHDGTMNLVTINLDGTEKTYLTSYNDLTWMQSPRWSPCGEYIAVAIFKNYRQNLYLVKADGSGMEALTWDAWEEQDPYFSADGETLYFSAEPDGVYNIFAMDLDTRKIRQMTNVIGGAMAPMETPEGNLVYTYYTAYGYKMYGLHAADFFNKPATHLFNVEPDPEEVEANLAFAEDFSEYEAATGPYRWSKALMPATAVPMFRLENDSPTNVGIQGGFQVFMQDLVEQHGGFIMALLGEDLLFLGQYFNQMWYPNFYLTAYHYEVKYDFGYRIDEDGDPDTTDDQYVTEGKNQQYANIAMGAIELPWSSKWSTFFYGRALEYGFRTASSQEFERYQWGWAGGLMLEFSNISGWYRYSPNPPAGRNVELSLTRAYTDVVYEPYGGVTTDDGELLDKYNYNEVELRWTEQVDLPTLGGLGFLKKAREKGHRLQFDGRVGFIDRNVNYNDEFRAGGQHPYYWGNNSLRPNTQFSGFPSHSLAGETMAIFNAAYRFPLAQNVHRSVGPLFVRSFWAQFAGTAGNLWSFRPPDDPDKHWRTAYGDRIAYDPADIKREIPFVDEAYKNGNRMLYDAAVEFRMSAGMFNYPYWDSFLRIAYGFNSIRGYGDVDGDGIYDTSDNALGDELSNEVHPAGFRVYIGLGTGW